MGADQPRSDGYRHVVACVESPTGSLRGIAEASRIARLGGSRLSFVHVAESAGAFTGGRTVRSRHPEEVAAELRAAALAWLAPLAEGNGAQAVVLNDDPSGALGRWARQEGADLIVACTRRRTLRRLLSDPPCPVLLPVGS